MRPSDNIIVIRHIWFRDQMELEREIKHLNVEVPIAPYEFIIHADRHRQAGLIFVLAISRNNATTDEHWLYFKRQIKEHGEAFRPGGIQGDRLTPRAYNRRADLED
jgi:hypothetical protein